MRASAGQGTSILRTSILRASILGVDLEDIDPERIGPGLDPNDDRAANR
jgi:hypothetical protein